MDMMELAMLERAPDKPPPEPEEAEGFECAWPPIAGTVELGSSRLLVSGARSLSLLMRLPGLTAQFLAEEMLPRWLARAWALGLCVSVALVTTVEADSWLT